MLRSFFIYALMAIGLSSCWESSFDDPNILESYVPVYASDSIAHTIGISEAKAIENPGKIFTYNQYLMVNIQGEGFHVIDNSNPSFPNPLFFIDVPGSNDVAIKDGVLYADNYGDIVVFTIDDSQQLQILERLPDVMNNQLYPPMRGVYFECVDESRGVVIDWVLSDRTDVNCYRP